MAKYLASVSSYNTIVESQIQTINNPYVNMHNDTCWAHMRLVNFNLQYTGDLTFTKTYNMGKLQKHTLWESFKDSIKYTRVLSHLISRHMKKCVGKHCVKQVG